MAEDNHDKATSKDNILPQPEDYVPITALDHVEIQSMTPSIIEQYGNLYTITLNPPVQEIDDKILLQTRKSYERYCNIQRDWQEKDGSPAKLESLEQYQTAWIWIIMPLRSTTDGAFQHPDQLIPKETARITEILEQRLQLRYVYARMCKRHKATYGELDINLSQLVEVLQQERSQKN